MKKFLVIQTASIGDVILATPVIECIHNNFPDAQIDFVIKKGMESLFVEHPFLNQLWVWDKKNGKYKQLHKLISGIRKVGYDYVINLQRFLSSGLITGFSKAKVKHGFQKNPLSFLLNKSFPHHIGVEGKYIHEIDRNLQLLNGVCVDLQANIKLYPTKENYKKTEQFKKQTYICLAPTSLWYTKQFPEERWIEFLKKCPKDLVVYFLGANGDIPICRKIISASGHKNCHNLAGQLNLLESASLMKDAKMNFVNDSAPQHLASAMNAPTTAIFCSTVPEFGFGPLSKDSKIIQIKEKLDCRPCGLHGYRECPKGHFKCAKDIDIKDLTSRICTKK
ncbi:MAG: glycosyltransferase family 9 protein [Bacteroidales bacterium]